MLVLSIFYTDSRIQEVLMSKHGVSKEETIESPKETETGSAEESSELSGKEPRQDEDQKPAPEPRVEPSVEAEEANWEQKSAELEAKIAEINDQYLRKAADFENFRKRINREKQDLTDFANQNLLLDLLPVIDDFERALKSAETSKDFASFYEGIRMIEKGLSSQLESRWGLKRFDSAGEPFDPNRHEAIQVEKTAGIAEPVVKEDYLKGYLLKERVIRCAKVKVLMPEGESAEGDSSA
jgi:molecular chaperone GrpE